MNKNKTIFASVFLTIVATLIFTGCKKDSNNQSETNTKSEKSQEILELNPGSMRGHIEIPGELQPFEKVDIYPNIKGFIKSIRVDRGSSVKKGEVLAYINAPELDAEYAEAVAKKHSSESQVQLRKATFLVTKDTYQRMLRLSATQGAISENELLFYKTKMTEDSLAHQSSIMEFKATSASAEAKMQQIEYLSIRAPFDGIVTERLVHPGALVKPELSKPMFRMSNINTLRLELAIPEVYAGRTAIGDTVFFTTNANIGTKFTGIVRRRSHSLNSSNRVEIIEADVPNPGHKLQAGMFAKAEIPFYVDQIWVVPTLAIITNMQNKFVVKVLADGQHEKVAVVTGLQNNQMTQINGNLKDGDKILLNAKEFHQ